ncbi:MAG: hypothetical protein RL660_849 [Bacteroidota bacterium]|jgi:DNA polymerase III psi subunit
MEILSLYHETLYIQPAEIDMAHVQGLFNKKICVLLRNTDHNDANLETLHKILSSCGISQDDTYIYTVPPHHVEEAVMSAIKTWQPAKLIAFDVPVISATMNLVTEIYALKTMSSTQLIFSHSLNYLAQNPQYKKNLWAALKQMFDIA